MTSDIPRAAGGKEFSPTTCFLKCEKTLYPVKGKKESIANPSRKWGRDREIRRKRGGEEKKCPIEKISAGRGRQKGRKNPGKKAAAAAVGRQKNALRFLKARTQGSFGRGVLLRREEFEILKKERALLSRRTKKTKGCFEMWERLQKKHSRGRGKATESFGNKKRGKNP